MQFTDATSLTGARKTADGYLVADVRCARTGCQTYLASEMGMDGGGTVTVYRPDTAVFSKDSMATFAGKPVTVGHPIEAVTADNWRQYAVGDIGEDIARDGEFIRVPIKLMDAAAIKSVEDGTREISMGYTTPIEMQDGVAPDGTKYQAIQTGPIRINHLAIVDRARGGEELRVGDAKKWGVSPTTTSKQKEDSMSDALKTVVLGDKAAQVAVADAQIIEQFKADQAKALTDAEAAHQAALATKDADIAKKDAEIADLKGKVLSDEAKAKLVADRVVLESTVARITADVAPAGLTDAALRKAVVAAKLGDAAVEGKSDAYIDARFDILAEDAAATDPVQDAMKSGLKPAATGTWGDSAFASAGVKMKKGA